MNRYIVFVALIITFMNGAVQGFAAPSARIKQAQKAFSEKKYRKSIDIYRRYLRKNRRDADAWTQLAVCFYFTGEPAKALTYLRRWEARTKLKSYSQYHQGLAYLGIGNSTKAKLNLTRAARFKDEFAGRSTFEMAVIEYNEREPVKAQYWLNLYKQRYPSGNYIREVLRIEQSLRSGVFIDGLKGNPKPDLGAALFKYHPYSLFPQPHYWFFDLGYDYRFGTENAPQQGPEPIKEQSISKHKLIVHGGIGAGPIKKHNVISWFGYNYRQDWYTDDERLTNWLGGEFQDYLLYFPFRPDLLERNHELYGQVTYPFIHGISFSLFGLQSFRFIGSELIPGPSGLEIEQKRAQTGKSTLIRPSVGVKYLQNYYTELFIHLNKEINQSANELSNQSYNLFGEGTAFVSFGLNQLMEFPEHAVNVAAQLFQYQYIFNDYWFDHTRTGFMLGAEYEFEPSFWINGALSIYEDSYELPILRQGSCNFSDPVDGATPADPEVCPRTDSGKLYEIGLNWDYSQFDRLTAKYRIIETENSSLKIYNRSESQILFVATMAFPNVREVKEKTERFGDAILDRTFD